MIMRGIHNRKGPVCLNTVHPGALGNALERTVVQSTGCNALTEKKCGFTRQTAITLSANAAVTLLLVTDCNSTLGTLMREACAGHT